MPSMRELLKDIRCGGSDYVGPFTYGLFEKLVAALEPEDTDATIRKLRNQRDGANEALEMRRTMCQSWERRCLKAEGELTIAKDLTLVDRKMMEELRQALTSAEGRIKELRGERNEAKAEIEELRAELMTDVQGLMADAKIGKLVRGMRGHSRLVKAGVGYYAQAIDLDAGGWHSSLAGLHAPAEALRAIQGVGDAEA